MAEAALGFIHDATTLLFGVFVSAAFLGIRMERRCVRDLLVFSLVFGAASAAVNATLGPLVSKQLYPLLVHVPLIAFLTLRFRQRPLACTIAVLIAYLCCQVSNWVGLATLGMTGLMWAYYLARIATTLATFAVLMWLLTSMDVLFLQRSTQTLLIFGILPAVYYVFDYTTNVYTSILHSGSVVAVEFLAFTLCIFYLLFLLVYFRQYEASEQARQASWMLRTQMEQSERELEAIRRSGRELAVLRHDMRHYLTSVSSYIERGETQRAQELISEVVATVAATKPERCCNNDVVNMVVATFGEKCVQRGVRLRVTATVPAQLSVPDVNLFALLSNALENAVNAAAQAEGDRRFIDFEARMSDDKLLICVSNTFGVTPVLANGLPQATREGHGLGTRSISYIVERLHGNCQFAVEDDRFVLRVVL